MRAKDPPVFANRMNAGVSAHGPGGDAGTRKSVNAAVSRASSPKDSTTSASSAATSSSDEGKSGFRLSARGFSLPLSVLDTSSPTNPSSDSTAAGGSSSMQDSASHASSNDRTAPSDPSVSTPSALALDLQQEDSLETETVATTAFAASNSVTQTMASVTSSPSALQAPKLGGGNASPAETTLQVLPVGQPSLSASTDTFTTTSSVEAVINRVHTFVPTTITSTDITFVPAPTGQSATGKSSSSKTAAVAGGAIGAVILLIGGLFLCLFVRRRRRSQARPYFDDAERMMPQPFVVPFVPSIVREKVPQTSVTGAPTAMPSLPTTGHTITAGQSDVDPSRPPPEEPPVNSIPATSSATNLPTLEERVAMLEALTVHQPPPAYIGEGGD
ncbi:hypothetical protein B0H12DRAFT_1241306 [Mycena haematopus]|nr:hypothetical protein B0H12DRAFT_1241306 [Mycena haematopus]